MLDWDRDVAGLAGVFGVDAPLAKSSQVPAGPPPPMGLPLPILEQARLTTARRGQAYEGFWRTTRPSVVMPGQFFHDHGMVRKNADGLLTIKVGGAGLVFDGWLLPSEGQLFGIMFDTVGQTPIFVTLNGVPLPRASTLDGLVMAAALNAARTPSAYPIMFQRIGDLSGDVAQDDAECAALVDRDPRATEETVPQSVRDHLVRDIGPAAAAKGGDLFLLASMANTLSRGATLGGQLTATLHAEPDELAGLQPLIATLTQGAGRVLFAGVPTGVSVTWAMQHGGPYPATSDAAHTSVGQTAVRRFVRPVTYQSAPAEVLPPALRDDNPLALLRRRDGVLTRD